MLPKHGLYNQAVLKDIFTFFSITFSYCIFFSSFYRVVFEFMMCLPLLVYIQFFVLCLSLFCPLSAPFPLSSPIVYASSPLLQFGDQVRQVHLYTGNKHRSYFVEILSNGTVSGNPNKTPYTVMELRAVKPGHTVIQGVTSSLYLCVNAAGQLIALSMFLDSDCIFIELIQPDGYTYFLSAHHRLPVYLSMNNLPEKRKLSFFRFLPLRNGLVMNTDEENREIPGHLSVLTDADLDSDDPFRITDQNSKSPSFHSDQ